MIFRRAGSTPAAITRRQFLNTSAHTVAGLSVGAQAMQRFAIEIPPGARHRRTSPNMWLPEPIPPDQLRECALIAMNAAREAGAEFADVRIGVQRGILVYGEIFGGRTQAELALGYGVRAWVDGTWSFQYGNVFTPDAIAATARSAVASARRSAKINVQLATHRQAKLMAATRAMLVDWAPTPVVTGTWNVPVAIDPFTVPIDDYQRLIGSLADAILPANIYRTASARGWNLQWRTETRVFASMAGSLVTQTTMCGGLSTQGLAKLPPNGSPSVLRQIPETDRQCSGFESVMDPKLPNQLRQLHDEVRRWRELPLRPFDEVGRYPMVFDGRTMASVVGNTVSAALDGDRVSSIEADASGGTFLSPAEDILNAANPTFSPLLSARVGRTLPSPMAVQWDDDGVVPEEYIVLDRGRVVDYHTTRETAPMLAEWYQQHGKPIRSHGCAVAPTPASVPAGSGGHLAVVPAPERAGLDDLVCEMTHGFLILSGAAGGSPGLSEGNIGRDLDCVMVEVRRGVPVARTGLFLQFKTPKLLNKDLVALGDATTVGTDSIQTWKGIPWQEITQFATAPAALVKDVEIMRW